MARRWTRAHDEQVRRILALMRVEARPFADDSDDAKAVRRALPFSDWFPLYMPHYAYCAPSAAHLAADDAVDETGIPIGLQWFRGAGKTVRYNIGKGAHRIVSQARKFRISAGRDEDVAADKMDLIKIELDNNPRLRQDYGSDIGPRSGNNEDTDWVACGTRVWARGIGQSPRGQLFGPYRPDDFCGDDLEDDVLARNPRREDQLEDWLFGQVFPALEGAGTKSNFLMLLNMFGRNCLSVRTREKAAQLDPAGRPLAKYILCDAVDERGNSTWPERYSKDALARAEAVMGTRLFRREMRCLEDDESSAFRPDWIHRFHAAGFNRAEAYVTAYCDPSARAAETNDFKAVIVLARPVGGEEIRCLHAWIRHASIGEMLNEIIRVQRQFQPGRFGCEDNGFQSLVWPLLQSRERDSRVNVNLFPVTNTAAKLDRIISNVNDFERGLVAFDPEEGDQKLLVDQFLDYGKPSVHDDGPDAYDGARRLLPLLHAGKPGEFYRGVRRENREAILI